MMKRSLYKLMIALATFSIGLSVSSIWNAHRAISLCDLEANPAHYAGKTIRVRAIFDRTHNYVTAYSICSSDSAPSASIELDANEAVGFPLLESHVSSSGEGDQIRLVDAMIVGQLDPYFGLGCFAPKYHITNAKVERVFSVEKFEDMPQAVKWIKSNSY